MIGSVLRTEHVEGSSTLLKYQFQSNENLRNTNLADVQRIHQFLRENEGVVDFGGFDDVVQSFAAGQRVGAAGCPPYAPCPEHISGRGEHIARDTPFIPLQTPAAGICKRQGAVCYHSVSGPPPTALPSLAPGVGAYMHVHKNETKTIN